LTGYTRLVLTGRALIGVGSVPGRSPGVGVDPATLAAGGALAMSPARMMAQRRGMVTRFYRG
jgi:hypothetical protein